MKPFDPTTKMADDARRLAVVQEVISLQRALEGQPRAWPPVDTPLASDSCPRPAEINSKVASTRAGNSALVTENENLAAYIDSLMDNISGMGALITADTMTVRDSPSLRGRLLGGGRRRAVKVNERVGELARKLPLTPQGASAHTAAGSKVRARLRSAPRYDAPPPLPCPSPRATSPLCPRVPHRLRSRRRLRAR